MSTYRIGYLVGSLAKGSINRKLAKALAKLAPPELALEEIPIGELPLYSYDYDADFPEVARRFKQAIAGVDGVLFVTPEYNRSIPGALKNAIDYLYREWNNKAAGFVSYGSAGGARAVEQLRLVMGELLVADVRAQVMLSLFTDFENFSTFTPRATHEKSVDTMLDQVIAWGGALKVVRKT